MRINTESSNAEILVELGKRIKACRIRNGYTQAELAVQSGVSTRTISSIEDGKSVQTDTLVSVLRSLGSVTSLEILLPSAELTPMELVQMKNQSPRQRFRKRKEDSRSVERVWKWGDDK